MMPLDPGRGIDQQRETRGMTFGKAITAEPLDLGKAPRGKVILIAVGPHAIHETALKIADRAVFPERRQRPAQPIRLGRSKPRTDDGDLHRLLLKQRHPQSLAQHPTQIVRREGHHLLPVSPPQIGMHHVTLNRARSDDGDLNDQIVKRFWPHPGQKVHLRPAFHLKHSQ